jgi:hypothetical protein
MGAVKSFLPAMRNGAGPFLRKDLTSFHGQGKISAGIGPEEDT